MTEIIPLFAFKLYTFGIAACLYNKPNIIETQTTIPLRSQKPKQIINNLWVFFEREKVTSGIISKIFDQN